MEISDKQPIQFIDFQTLEEYSFPFRQLVNRTDKSFFQVKIDDEEFLGSELLTNNDFTSGLTGWTQTGTWSSSSNLAKYTNQGSNGEIYQAILTIGETYSVTIDIESMTGEDFIEVFLGTESIGQITEAGTYTYTGTCAGNTNLKVVVDVDVNNYNACEIDSVSVMEITTVSIGEFLRVAIMEEDNTFVQELTTSTDYVNGDYVTFEIDWVKLGLDYGCYKVVLYDPDENWYSQTRVNNGTFEIDLGETGCGWVETSPGASDISFGPSGATFTFDVSSVVNRIDQDAILKNGATYDVTLVIDSVTDCDIDVKMGTASSATYTTSGTKTFQLTADDDNLRVRAQNTNGATSTCVITSIQIKMVSSEAFPEWESHPFKYGYFGNTKLVRVSNDNDSFDMDFTGSYTFTDGSGKFQPRIRLDAEFNGIVPSISKESTLGQAGEKSNFFSESRYIRKFQIDFLPDHLVQFMSLFAQWDNIDIDNEEYFVSEPEFEFTEAGSVRGMTAMGFSMEKKTQNRIVQKDDSTNLNEIASLADGFEDPGGMAVKANPQPKQIQNLSS